MRRATVQRAMSCPSRRDRSQSLRALSTFRCARQMAMMIGFHRSSDTSLEDGPGH